MSDPHQSGPVREPSALAASPWRLSARTRALALEGSAGEAMARAVDQSEEEGQKIGGEYAIGDPSGGLGLGDRGNLAAIRLALQRRGIGPLEVAPSKEPQDLLGGSGRYASRSTAYPGDRRL